MTGPDRIRQRSCDVLIVQSCMTISLDWFRRLRQGLSQPEVRSFNTESESPGARRPPHQTHNHCMIINDLSSDGSRDVCPLSVHFFSFSCIFLAKIMPNNKLAPSLVLAPPCESFMQKNRSADVIFLTFETWNGIIFAMQCWIAN